MNNHALKENIMLRVKTVHLARKFIHPFRLKLFIFALSVMAIEFLVSVPSVLQNMFSERSFQEMIHYFFFAFFHTHFLVQVITLITLLSAGWLLKDAIEGFKDALKFRIN